MDNKNRKESILAMLVTEPNDVFLNYALAMEFLSETNLKEADIQLKRTLALNNEYLPCYYQLGQISEKLNTLTTAIDYYTKGIELAKKQANTKALGELKEALWMLED